MTNLSNARLRLDAEDERAGMHAMNRSIHSDATLNQKRQMGAWGESLHRHSKSRTPKTVSLGDGGENVLSTGFSRLGFENRSCAVFRLKAVLRTLNEQ